MNDFPSRYEKWWKKNKKRNKTILLSKNFNFIACFCPFNAFLRHQGMPSQILLFKQMKFETEDAGETHYGTSCKSFDWNRITQPVLFQFPIKIIEFLKF